MARRERELIEERFREMLVKKGDSWTMPLRVKMSFILWFTFMVITLFLMVFSFINYTGSIGDSSLFSAIEEVDERRDLREACEGIEKYGDYSQGFNEEIWGDYTVSEIREFCENG